MITEIGGTVGDIESLPFLEAIRQFPVGRRARPLHVHPPHAGAVHRPRGRAEDQADAALGQRAAPHRHPAGHGASAAPRAACRRTSARRSRCSPRCRWTRSCPARDVDNIYKVPLVLPRRGRGRLRARALRHRGRRRPTSAAGSGWSAAPARPQQRRAGAGSRWSASTSSSRTRTCRSSRRCATRASSTAAAIEIDWVDSETLDDGEVRDARSRSADGILIPGGFGVRGIEGKIDGRADRPRAEDPVPRHLPRHADGGRRLRAPRGRHGRRELDRVRPRDAVPGDRPPARAEGGRRHGRHDAPGRRPGEAPRRTRAAREIYGEAVIYERHRHRYEVNNFLRQPARGRRAGVLAARRRTSAWSRSSRSPTTRSSSPRSTTPSSSRARSAPRRCSATSWAPRSSTPRERAPAESRDVPSRRRARPATSARAAAGRFQPQRVRPASEAEQARLNETFAALCRIASPFGHERAVRRRASRAELRGDGARGREDEQAGRPARQPARAHPGPRRAHDPALRAPRHRRRRRRRSSRCSSTAAGRTPTTASSAPTTRPRSR